jgi:hypothetical protein
MGIYVSRSEPACYGSMLGSNPDLPLNIIDGRHKHRCGRLTQARQKIHIHKTIMWIKNKQVDEGKPFCRQCKVNDDRRAFVFHLDLPQLMHISGSMRAITCSLSISKPVTKNFFYIYFFYSHTSKLIIFLSTTHELNITLPILCTGGSQIDVALVYTVSPNEGGFRGLSKWVQLCTRSPDKLWRLHI